MNYSNLIKIASSALKRNKFRAFLTMLGIIIGVASVIAMLAIGQGSKKSIEDQMTSMGTNLINVFPGSQFRGGIQLGNAGAQNLSLKDVEAIRNNCPDIVAVSPEVRSSGQAVFGHQNWPTSMYGTNAEYFSIRKRDIESGRPFTEKEIKSLAKVCLIGKTVVTNLFGENADPVGLEIRFKNIPFKVIGVLASKGESNFGQDQDDLLIAPYTTVQKRILAIPYIQSIYASAVSAEKSPEALDEVEATLRDAHKLAAGQEDDFRVRSQEELVSTFTSISDVLTALLAAIAGISLLVGGIGIMNIMYVSVTERTREIGLRMSVGGKEKDIMVQFLIESIMLSVIGGITGILLGIFATRIVGGIMNWPVVISPQSIILSFVVCTAIGIFFGWYPARKAASLNPIDAVRYE